MWQATKMKTNFQLYFLFCLMGVSAQSVRVLSVNPRIFVSRLFKAALGESHLRVSVPVSWRLREKNPLSL